MKIGNRERIYEILLEKENYLKAYQKIRSKPGNMTPGIDKETLDGISIRWIEETIEELRRERFEFKPSRRIYIPKKNGKKRPLGIPSPKDKIVQEIMRKIIEEIYEPLFKEKSHGFRPGKSCHTALKKIKENGEVTWIIEGDLKGYYDNIDHQILESLLRKEIKDQRFINLYWKAVKAGYMEESIYKGSEIGIPQGGIISPILSNVYLHEFDKYMEEEIAKSEKKIIYERYADDFIIGIEGTLAEAKIRKEEIKRYLNTTLKIELNEDKTKITNIHDEKVKFLGVQIEAGGKENKLEMPKESIINKLIEKKLIDSERKPIAYTPWIPEPVYQIIIKYNSIVNGIRNYYSISNNKEDMEEIIEYLKESLVETIGKKLGIPRKKVYEIYGSSITSTKEKTGKKVTFAQVKIKKPTSNKEYTTVTKYKTRTNWGLESNCKICGSTEEIEMHHVKHIKKSNTKIKGFTSVMSRINRKQIPVCKKCHKKIHKGLYDGIKLSDIEL